MPHARLCNGCGDIVTQHKDGHCPRCRTAYIQRRNTRPEHLARIALPEAQRQRVYRRDNDRCVDCGSTHDLTIDHIIPLITGKRHYRDDELRVLCRTCNSRRGGKLRHGALLS